MQDVNVHFNSKPIEQRIFNLSMPEPNSGCWIWFGDSVKGGYGRMRMGTKNKLAHRVSYEYYIGSIPQGFEVHHKCNNTSCINPTHLGAITPKENTLLSSSPSALNAKKTFCKRGHEFAPENIIHSGKNSRRCKTCTVELAAKRYLANSEYYKNKAKEYHRNKRLNSQKFNK